MPSGVYKRIKPSGGWKLSNETRHRMSIARLGKRFGPFSLEARKRMSLSHIGNRPTEETKKKMSVIHLGRKAPWMERKGELNHNWIKDRTKLAKRQERNDSVYKEWRQKVWLRDNFKCKIANPDCAGRLEAHHILGWTAHPELRYEINNGITLCHAHHPRKRAEEKRLSPYFQELVSVSKE